MYSMAQVALGVGTKYLTSLYCTDDGRVDEAAYWGSVRDSHAEVLARRAFLRFLYLSMEALLLDPASSHEIFLPLPTAEDDKTAQEPFHLFQLRPEVHFHLYTSSQPCGNACVKKFAKGTKPV
jgi:tRNA-specific adenosine deaminase 1